jgi:hypothetical protein
MNWVLLSQKTTFFIVTAATTSDRKHCDICQNHAFYSTCPVGHGTNRYETPNFTSHGLDLPSPSTRRAVQAQYGATLLVPYRTASSHPEITAAYLMMKNVVTLEYAVKPAYSGNPRVQRVVSVREGLGLNLSRSKIYPC